MPDDCYLPRPVSAGEFEDFAEKVSDRLTEIEGHLRALRTEAESIGVFLATAFGKGAPIPEALARAGAATLGPVASHSRIRVDPKARLQRTQDLLDHVGRRLGGVEQGGDAVARQSCTDLARCVQHLAALVEEHCQ